MFLQFLDLQHKHPTTQLVPLMDIEQIWQSHLIRTSNYASYCQTQYHTLIDHNATHTSDAISSHNYGPNNEAGTATMAASGGFVERYDATCKLWREAYGEAYAEQSLLHAGSKQAVDIGITEHDVTQDRYVVTYITIIIIY